MTVVVDHPAPGVMGLWLDRPACRNAVDATLIDALHDAIDACHESVVVLGSTDSSTFCAGADLEIADDERTYVSNRLHELYGRLVALPAIVIAAISGAAVGGGAQLGISADLRVAAPSARLRFPGIGHGLVVGAWGLPSLVGRGRAMDLCLTMRWVGAAEALNIGLVDRVVDNPRHAALALAREVAGADDDAVVRLKNLVVRSSGLARAVEDERIGNTEAWTGSVAGLQRNPL